MKKLNIYVALLISTALLGCNDETSNKVSTPKLISSAPGAPGETPYWSYAGKTGIGTSYEAYMDGEYSDKAVTGKVSKVWFSLAKGIITETMFGLIHQAQIKDMQFIIKGKDFIATELDDTESKIEYLYTDEKGRPLSLAYKVTNTDKQGRFIVEKHIFTDPNENTLFVRAYFTALKGELSAYMMVNPYVNNNGIGDSAKIQNGDLIAWDQDNYVAVTSKQGFLSTSVGFVGTSDGLTDLKDNNTLDYHYNETGKETGNVALFAELGPFEQRASFDISVGFGDSADLSIKTAKASIQTGYQQVLDNYNGKGDAVGWVDYLTELKQIKELQDNTRDQGKLLNTSIMVLKAQEDKTHAGAVIASLSNPWGDTVNAEKGHTGYKAVWVRDFYQVAMAFLAFGDSETAKTAFSYLKKVQVTDSLVENKGDTGWFLQKTHVDGEVEWVGVQLDQTAMPIMLAWKLWQANVLSDKELTYWYKEMLKPAADFLVDGGIAKILWNDTKIIPPITQQERWEEQSGYSPSTIAAIISGLITANDIAKLAGDEEAAIKYLTAAKKYSADIEKLMFTTQGTLSKDHTQYFFRLAKDTNPNSNVPLSDNNGRVGLDKRSILDGGFLELVRYGVRPANDKYIENTLKLYDNEDLPENLKVKYSFQFDGMTGSFPGWRRYGNDGYGEDEVNGQNYAENGKNSQGQRGRVWPMFTGERGHFELANLLTVNSKVSTSAINKLKDTYVQAMELFANEGMMLPEQVWDDVGNNPNNYIFGQGTNSATPLAWTHAEYIKLVRSLTDRQVWDHYPVVAKALEKEL